MLIAREDSMRYQTAVGCGLREYDGGLMRTMCGSRTGGWSLPCVMSD
jgi:hypothetical protein